MTRASWLRSEWTVSLSGTRHADSLANAVGHRVTRARRDGGGRPLPVWAPSPGSIFSFAHLTRWAIHIVGIEVPVRKIEEIAVRTVEHGRPVERAWRVERTVAFSARRPLPRGPRVR